MRCSVWKLSGILFTEVFFQSALTAGNMQVEKAARNSRWAPKLNKFIFSIFLAFISLYPAFTLLPEVCAITFLMLIFVVVFFGTAFATSYYSTDFSYLRTLPLAEEDLSKIQLLTFFRLFDIPLVVAFITFTAASAIAVGLHSVPIAAIGFSSVAMFSISALVYIGRKMHGRISSPIVRAISVIAWMFAIYGSYLLMRLVSVLMSNPATLAVVRKVSLLFPFCFGYAMFDLAHAHVVASLAYFAASAYAFKAATTKIEFHGQYRFQFEFSWRRLKIRGVTTALVIKDFRLLSRSPSHLAIALLPLVEGIAYSVYFLPSAALGIVAITTVQIFMSITASTLTHVDRSGYALVLPVSVRKVLAAKVLGSLVIYAASLAVIFATLIVRGIFSPSQLSIIPSGIAVVVLAVYLSRETAEGFNPMAIAALIAAFVLVYLPPAVGFFATLFGKPFAPVAFAVSVAECLVTGAVLGRVK